MHSCYHFSHKTTVTVVQKITRMNILTLRYVDLYLLHLNIKEMRDFKLIFYILIILYIYIIIITILYFV